MCLFSTAATRKQRVRLWYFKIYRLGGRVGFSRRRKFILPCSHSCNLQSPIRFSHTPAGDISPHSSSQKNQSCSVLSYLFVTWPEYCRRRGLIYTTLRLKSLQEIAKTHRLYAGSSMESRFPHTQMSLEIILLPVTPSPHQYLFPHSIDQSTPPSFSVLSVSLCLIGHENTVDFSN